MKKRTIFISTVIFALTAATSLAMQSHDSQGSGSGHDMQSHDSQGSGSGHNMQSGQQMDHTGMGGTFRHEATEGGIDAQFQVMSLASMNMTSDKGETHHIMVDLKEADGGAPIKNAVGKIKVIAPDKTEQEGALKNYNGILAANFTFKEPGKYGVICLLKNQAEKQVFKFWYEHMR